MTQKSKTAKPVAHPPESSLILPATSALRPHWQRLFMGAINYLIPDSCCLCDTLHPQQPRICSPCLGDLPWQSLHCHQCGLQLSLEENVFDNICGQCLAHPPNFDRAVMPFDYAYPLNSLISRFKHQKDQVAGQLLADLLAEHLQDHFACQPQAVIPQAILATPLHWFRHWRRGYNQSHILALACAKALNIPCITGVRRIKATPRQQGLKRKQRLKNLKGCFFIPHYLPYEHIALVDDVVTTASTMNELAQTAKAKGVKQVDVWALARTQ